MSEDSLLASPRSSRLSSASSSSSGVPVRKKLKLEDESVSSPVDSSEDEASSSCGMRRRKKDLHNERLSRLRELILSYREHMKELHGLCGGKEEAFKGYLLSKGPPASVLRALSLEEPPRPPALPVYTPRAGFLSPVKYGENLERTTPLMAASSSILPRGISREDLLSKARTETWVGKRVQDLIREGLWSSRRLPKVVERLRPRVHWDSLLCEMTWMATDFHQERKWKKAAAKMLAYSAKDYVERLGSRRLRMRDEEEIRRRRVAGFMASQVRDFWKRIHTLSEMKLSRQQRVLEYQMLEQQLSYVNTEKSHEGADSPRQGSSKGENGVGEETEKGEVEEDESSSSEDDDESTILEQELYEERLQAEEARLLSCPKSEPQLELDRLQADSQRPLFHILRKDYPGVVSEYLDLYDHFVQEEEFSSSDDEEESSSSSEDEELQLMTPPESGNSLVDVQRLSIDSLLSRKQQSIHLKSRDIQTLAEEAERLKSSLRHPDVPQGQVLPLLRGGELREYQRVGVDWLISMHKSRLNGAIGDDPGLGRKVMVVSFLSWLASADPCRKPHLLIVPVSSLANWASTLATWCPSLSVQRYEGSEVNRRSLRRAWRCSTPRAGGCVILTSYRVFFGGDSIHFLKRSWNYLILHDAQNLGRVSQMNSILDLKSSYRLSLLGGHLPSNPIDLWNILYLLHPRTYTLHKHQEIESFVEGTEEYAETVKKLIGIISPFLLRRTTSSVERQLPLPQEKVYILQMLPRQRRLYDDFLASSQTRSTLMGGDPLGVSEVLGGLRRICDHPSLVLDERWKIHHTSSSCLLPPLKPLFPKLCSAATAYDPLRDIDLNSMNFVFFTHETTLTVIISDRIRKSRAPRSLIEELPLSKSDAPLQQQQPPSVPCGRLHLEFQTTANSASYSSSCNSSRASTHGSGSSSNTPHILLSASVIKSLKSSLGSGKSVLPPSSTHRVSSGSSKSSLGAFHKESLRTIASFNERRCMGLPLYGKDLVDILTIVTSNRPTKSMFRGMGLANTLAAAASPDDDDKKNFRYQTKGLRSLVNASSTAYKQIHSESTIISKILCVSPRVFLFPPVVSVPPDSSYLNRNNSQHSDDDKPFTSTCSQLLWNLLPSSKLNKLNDILSQAAAKRERVALFCETKEMRDLLLVFLRSRFYSYVLLDPEDSFESKAESLLAFSSPLEPPFVLLTSPRTSAIGLNVSCLRASHVILYDSSWDHDGFKSNPWVQAIARSPGVVIHRLLCKASVEENISRKSVQKKIAADLNNSLEHPQIACDTLDDIFDTNLRDNGTTLSIHAYEKSSSSTSSRGYSSPSSHLRIRGVDLEDNNHGGAATLEHLWSNDSNDMIKSLVVDLAELDPGLTLECSSFGEEILISSLDISTHKLFDNLTPIERFGLGKTFSLEEADEENFASRSRSEWERSHHRKLLEFEEEVSRLERMTLLTFSGEDAKRVWSGAGGEPMPLWLAPAPSSGMAPDSGSDLSELHLSSWYATDRFMEDAELPPVYVKKDASLKRSSFEAGLLPGDITETSAAKPKLKKEDASSLAPRSLFDRPSPGLPKGGRKDIMRLNKFRPVNNTSSSSPSPAVNSALAGIRNPLPRTQVEAENTPEWLIQEDWALHQAVEDLLELPLNLTVIHPGHTPNWDMVADMVNSVSRIYRGPRQCKNRYESIIVPREEGRILYDIIPPALNNGGGAVGLKKPPSSSKKSSGGGSSNKSNNNLLKMIPGCKQQGMKTSQLYYSDNNLKWTCLYRSRFENIKSVANKRTPTAKPILVNPTQKNPKHAAVLAESGISYELPLNPIIVAQNRADRLQKEKQKTQAQAAELSQQRIASAQAAAAAAQQTAAATASRTPQTVVVGLSGSQQQQQGAVRSGNAVVVSSPSTVVTFNRLQAAQKVMSGSSSGSTGRPLTPAQVNLLRQQALISKSSGDNKLRLTQGPSKTLVSQAGSKGGPQIRQLTTMAGGSKTTSVRALTEQDMKILVAKQQQKVQLPVTAAQLFAQAGIKVQEGQPVATLVKTVSAIGQGGQSVTIPVQSVPHMKAALARGQQMHMKLLQQQLLQRKATPGGSPGAGGSKGLPTQLIVQKNVVPHQAVTVQQILKGATPHAVLTKQGSSGPIQARVIPASSSGGRNPQTIQVVSGRPGGGQFKVSASSVANSQQILNQVSAALGQPVSMAVRTSDGTPVSVALRSNPLPGPKATIITSTANNNPSSNSNPGNSKDSSNK